jgi:hypothetical protein
MSLCWLIAHCSDLSPPLSPKPLSPKPPKPYAHSAKEKKAKEKGEQVVVKRDYGFNLGQITVNHCDGWAALG